MSKELLEKALQKTKEIEEKENKRMRIASALGMIAGSVLAITLDATAVWLIVKFMLGVSSFTWIGGYGVVLLVMMLQFKFKK